MTPTKDPADPAGSSGPTKTAELSPSDEPSPEMQERLKELDRESRTREFDSKWLAWTVGAIAVGLSLYHVYTSILGTPPTLLHRSIHVAVILVLTFALHYWRAHEKGKGIPWFDWILMAAAVSTSVYLVISYEDLVTRGGNATTLDIVFGAILIVLVLEAARRVTGWFLPALAVLFLVYAYYGRSLPGFLKHRGYDWDRIATHMYTSVEGVFSTAIGVSSTYIFLFILFGAFLQKSGMGKFFNDIALALAGQTRGGPAKVAVIASGFLGSINGSAIANVVTTGAFTIPLMKKIGYNKNFAGAVESAASVGGQILPPVMGAAAFIMAENLGIPYGQIALVAIVPALLFYLGIIIQVHLRATSQGLEGISRKNLPAVGAVLKERGHLVLPLLFLIYMLFFSGTTIIFSAMLTIGVTILAAQVRKTTRMSIRQIVEALRDGAFTAVSVAIACACVGLVVGVASLTGFGVKLASTIVDIGGGMLLPTLLMTAFACLILGMGLPSIPAYIITATMAAPALTQMGVEPIAAHLFVFYFGLFANITPPVALASFAAAGVSGGSPMTTGFLSLRLAIAGFIVPFIFVYDPALLMQDVTVGSALLVVLTALIGIAALAAAAEGHFLVPLNWVFRILLIAGALTMLVPGVLTDAIGVGVLALVVIVVGVIAQRKGQLRWSAV
ncbi:TRAP transporter permease [Brevibacterium litoralis]|uniref:TRAP transporter permease n=1 Tax=Brevibacterium litoralis TaxID=3138935 RepID=UPI0032EAE71B